MQAVILAAGKGKRLMPLTNSVPKPMVDVAGKKIIEYSLENLPDEITEIIIVIGYHGEKIKKHFGNNYNNKKLKYVWQKQHLGTGHALSLCKRLLKNKFLVLCGDNIYKKQDVKACLKYELAILVKAAKGEFMAVNEDEKQNFSGLKKVRGCGLMNTGLYVLNKNFFKYKLVKLENKNEYGLPQTMLCMAKDYPIKIVRTKNWLQINDHKELHSAEKILIKKISKFK